MSEPQTCGTCDHPVDGHHLFPDSARSGYLVCMVEGCQCSARWNINEVHRPG